jgi:uncharacterized protein YbaR (Trm112 family)
MHIELIELLRCPRAHEESWLVAALHEVRERVVLQGKLGCPVCGAEFPIVDGVARMGGPDGEQTLPRPAATPAGDASDAWRLAALLDLRPPTAVGVLTGANASVAQQLLEIYAGGLVLLNPLRPPEPRARVATVLAPDSMPLRSRSAHAIALESGDERLLPEAVRVLTPGGRLVAPASWPVPEEVRQIARDDFQWVAAAPATTAPVQLTISRGDTAL